MKTKRFFSIALTMTLCFSAVSYRAQGQELARKDKNRTDTSASTSSVSGNGAAGSISKWTGVSGSTTYVLGNSNIFEDKFGKIGIGTTNPTSLLTVQGMIEITLGGLKFPDGTLQTTAGLSSVFHDASLTGNGTQASPLGIANGGVQAIHLANGVAVRSLNGLTDNVSLAGSGAISVTPSGNTLIISAPTALTVVTTNTTLTGSGTQASPLGVAVPLSLTGALSTDVKRRAHAEPHLLLVAEHELPSLASNLCLPRQHERVIARRGRSRNARSGCRCASRLWRRAGFGSQT